MVTSGLALLTVGGLGPSSQGGKMRERWVFASSLKHSARRRNRAGSRSWGLSSAGLSRGEGWPMERRLTRLKRFLQRAVETRMAMHLWLHPSLDLDDYRGLLVPFLRACAELREAGRLDVVTMSGLVSAVDTL